MRKSRQFWHDADFAISSLMLRELIHEVIVEGRKTRQSLWDINEAAQLMPGRNLVLFRYREVMMARCRNHDNDMQV